MNTTTISIAVDPQSADVFIHAPEEQRRKLELLLALRLRELTTMPNRSLQAIMDEMGAQAAAKWLTPEILESLLHDVRS